MRLVNDHLAGAAQRFGKSLQRAEPRLVDGMRYTHSTATDVTRTWERHGFKPMTPGEREHRQIKAGHRQGERS